MRKYKSSLILVAIFAIVLITHFSCKIVTSTDSVWSIPTALSIVREFNTDLNEYPELLKELHAQNTENFDGHIYTVYPVGAPLVAAPFVAILNLTGVDVVAERSGFELFIASTLVAITSVFIFLIARFYLDTGLSLLTTFIFAFCTSALSTLSRALWQHGPSVLMLTIALYLILLARQKTWLIQYVSLPLAFSYVSRPTNSVSIVVISLFVLVAYRRYFVRYILWSLPVAIPFLLFNLLIYHKLLSTYYQGGFGYGFSITKMGEALAGHLISPSRGLFLFTPILLFSVWGIVIKLRQKQKDKLDFFLAAIIILHWITLSLWTDWFGGHCYGPRMLSDMLPYFIYFLIPAIQRIMAYQNWKKIVLLPVFSCFMAISFLIHFRGATSPDVQLWNSTPREMIYRVWDWSDPQFLRDCSKGGCEIMTSQEIITRSVYF